MKNKKILIISIAIVMVLIIIILGALGITYMKTDFLKSDAQLFAKYIGIVGDRIENFGSEELKTYLEKTNNTPYESEGKLTADVNVEGLADNQLENIDKLNITFSGKTNKSRKRAEQKIKINYSDDVSFPINYIQTSDLYGISSELVLTKYLALDVSNLDKLLEKFGITEIDSDSIYNSNNKMSSITDVPDINKEDVKELLQSFKTTITENVTDANFSKSGEDSFILTLNQQETLKILKALVVELKEKGIFTEEQMKEYNDSLKEAEFNASSQEYLKITVNKTGRINIDIDTLTFGLNMPNDNEIYIWLSDKESETNISFETVKSQTNGEVAYKTEILSNANNIVDLEVTYSNLTAQNVKEKYVLSLGMETEDGEIPYQYTLDVSKKFSDNIEIEELNEENSVILNDASEEYISKLIELLPQRIAYVNDLQMSQLGVSENPLILANPVTYIVHQYIVNSMMDAIE